jgi:uncharacterized protein (DUF2147 family)
MNVWSKIAMSTLAAALVAAPMAASAAPTETDVTAKKVADAKIHLSADDVAVGVGIIWGKGALSYKGQTYPLSIDGLSLIDVGAAHVSLSGSVYDLKSLKDFNGTYTALSAGATLAGGVNAVILRNQNGVLLKLTGDSEGFSLKLAAEGLKVKLKKSF